MAGNTTGQQVFDIAMGLSDNISSSGLSDTSDNTEYKTRTLRILNALRLELYPLSDTYAVGRAGERPVSALLTDLSDRIDLDDYLAQTVMPYGLAAHLLIDENPNSASFFEQRYEEMKAGAAKIPSEFEAISDVYRGNRYNEFSSW
jgi:hypothetical protein